MSNTGDEGAYFIYTGQWFEDIPQDVICVRVHPSVRRIVNEAFAGCLQLTIVILGEGLEEIGRWAFCGCTSLRVIVIPPTVRVIHKWAFAHCSQLTIVVLGKGLEEIGQGAFLNCTSLREIAIPPAIRVIREAFDDCLQLTNVRFCNKIEEFVSVELMQDWWNHGVRERSLSTYCFLVRCNIPQRLGLV
jgi:hypothetical protein